jgi:RNA polymerase sigma factor (sigma-70 family)
MKSHQFALDSIIVGCRASRRDSQRLLYECFHGYGLSIALRYSKDRVEAVEILNDAFLKVFKKIDLYDTAQAFKPWFRRIVIYTAIDYHRASHRFPIHLALSAAAEMPDSTADLFPILPEDDVLPLLQTLAPAYRMVFNLYVMEEYDHQEIAALLGISESTSRSNLARAKENLRRIYSKTNINASK